MPSLLICLALWNIIGLAFVNSSLPQTFTGAYDDIYTSGDANYQIVNSSCAYDGTCYRAKSTGSITTCNGICSGAYPIDSTGYTDIVVSFYLTHIRGAGNGDCYLSWADDGSSYTEIRTYNVAGTYNNEIVRLPSGADDNNKLSIKFGIDSSSTTDQCFIDEIVVYSDPVTPSPTTPAPITSAPITAVPTSASPTTPAPTTADPTTAAPITADPTTSSPTTSDPTTAEPTTDDPTTAQPTTGDPTTDNPTTSDPTTANPTTADPTTGNPTSAAPTTANPTTGDPTTDEPSTQQPTTEDPTTADPTTSSPMTAAPVTSSPITAAPVTAAPVTAAPVTSEPTTGNPTTAEPTEESGDSGGGGEVDESSDDSQEANVADTAKQTNSYLIANGDIEYLYLVILLLVACCLLIAIAVFIERRKRNNVSYQLERLKTELSNGSLNSSMSSLQIIGVGATNGGTNGTNNSNDGFGENALIDDDDDDDDNNANTGFYNSGEDGANKSDTQSEDGGDDLYTVPTHQTRGGMDEFPQQTPGLLEQATDSTSLQDMDV